MPKALIYTLAGIILFFTGFSPAQAAVETGQPAPDFEAVDINGDTIKLS